ncbi:MAG: di-trans,poly-cis-decaprenylcistransferase [Acidobacteria bacterium]|nr:di-trans,poly-cis-decaprenylcistransferase [Acidobacteriota bacterium]
MQRAAAAPAPLHVAIIMDGNGRWANSRGLARTAGHRAGADAVRRTVEAAPGLGVGTLTLYAFSSDNWQRPAEEVGALMSLLRAYLRAETARCIAEGVRVSVIGRRDRLPRAVRSAIARAERATAAGARLHLRVAVDYSARHAIMEAAREPGPAALTREEFAVRLGRAIHARGPAPDVDLLIRTGGEKRLSDFLLWEAAYAELWFTDRMWPDFSADDLGQALADFRSRDRRFGGIEAKRLAHV